MFIPTNIARFRLVAFVLFVATPSAALAAGAARTYSELVDQLVTLMGNGVTFLVALAIAIYVYGMTTNINEFGNESNPEKKKALFFWGIIIIFVMVSIWGIIRIVGNTLFNDQSAPSQQQQLPLGQQST